MVKSFDAHGKSNRRSFEAEKVQPMVGLDRLKTHLRYGDEVKSFVASSQFVGKMSFQEVFYKIKVGRGFLYMVWGFINGKWVFLEY